MTFTVYMHVHLYTHTSCSAWPWLRCAWGPHDAPAWTGSAWQPL